MRDELLLLLYIDFSLFANSKILLLLTKWSALSCPLGELQPIVTLCQSELEKYNSEDIYVIGGESVYRQLIDECDVAHVTKIDFAYDADAHFPDLDADPAWEITADSEEQTYFDLEYYFYRRRVVHNLAAGKLHQAETCFVTLGEN